MNYVKKFYFGSISWDKKVHDIFLDKQIIRSYSVQEMLDGTRYESTKMLKLNVVGTLKRAKFDEILGINPSIKSILKSLGLRQVADLCRLCYSGNSNYTINKIIDEKSDEIKGYTYTSLGKKPQSRKIFLNKPFTLDKEVYAGVEFKGCGKEGGPIIVERFRNVGDTSVDMGPEGGLYLEEAEKEVKIQGELNKRGGSNPLQIVGFRLPIKVLSPYFGERQLGLVVRGVKASFRISELPDTAGSVVFSLGIAPEEYAEKVIENMFKDLKLIFQAGYYHESPTDENVDGTGGITDLGSLLSLENSKQIQYNLMNFKRVANSLWFYLTGRSNEKYISEKIKEIFGVSDLTEISTYFSYRKNK
jgi:hypothetical protein